MKHICDESWVTNEKRKGPRWGRESDLDGLDGVVLAPSIPQTGRPVPLRGDAGENLARCRRTGEKQKGMTPMASDENGVMHDQTRSHVEASDARRKATQQNRRSSLK